MLYMMNDVTIPPDDITWLGSQESSACLSSVFQMEIEKKKAKKIAEQKKSVDARLDQEMNRNTDLQKEMYR